MTGVSAPGHDVREAKAWYHSKRRRRGLLEDDELCWAPPGKRSEYRLRLVKVRGMGRPPDVLLESVRAYATFVEAEADIPLFDVDDGRLDVRVYHRFVDE